MNEIEPNIPEQLPVQPQEEVNGELQPSNEIPYSGDIETKYDPDVPEFLKNIAKEEKRKAREKAQQDSEQGDGIRTFPVRRFQPEDLEPPTFLRNRDAIFQDADSGLPEPEELSSGNEKREDRKHAENSWNKLTGRARDTIRGARESLGDRFRRPSSPAEEPPPASEPPESPSNPAENTQKKQHELTIMWTKMSDGTDFENTLASMQKSQAEQVQDIRTRSRKEVQVHESGSFRKVLGQTLAPTAFGGATGAGLRILYLTERLGATNPAVGLIAGAAAQLARSGWNLFKRGEGHIVSESHEKERSLVESWDSFKNDKKARGLFGAAAKSYSSWVEIVGGQGLSNINDRIAGINPDSKILENLLSPDINCASLIERRSISIMHSLNLREELKGRTKEWVDGNFQEINNYETDPIYLEENKETINAVRKSTIRDMTAAGQQLEHAIRFRAGIPFEKFGLEIPKDKNGHYDFKTHVTSLQAILDGLDSSTLEQINSLTDENDKTEALEEWINLRNFDYSWTMQGKRAVGKGAYILTALAGGAGKGFTGFEAAGHIKKAGSSVFGWAQQFGAVREAGDAVGGRLGDEIGGRLGSARSGVESAITQIRQTAQDAGDKVGGRLNSNVNSASQAVDNLEPNNLTGQIPPSATPTADTVNNAAQQIPQTTPTPEYYTPDMPTVEVAPDEPLNHEQIMNTANLVMGNLGDHRIHYFEAPEFSLESSVKNILGHSGPLGQQDAFKISANSANAFMDMENLKTEELDLVRQTVNEINGMHAKTPEEIATATARLKELLGSDDKAEKIAVYFYHGQGVGGDSPVNKLIPDLLRTDDYAMKAASLTKITQKAATEAVQQHVPEHPKVTPTQLRALIHEAITADNNPPDSAPLPSDSYYFIPEAVEYGTQKIHVEEGVFNALNKTSGLIKNNPEILSTFTPDQKQAIEIMITNPLQEAQNSSQSEYLVRFFARGLKDAAKYYTPDYQKLLNAIVGVKSEADLDAIFKSIYDNGEYGGINYTIDQVQDLLKFIYTEGLYKNNPTKDEWALRKLINICLMYEAKPVP